MSKNLNKKSKAVALSYDEKIHSAPKIIAKGNGIVAENLIETAIANNIPVQVDTNLVELLSKLEINESIPEDLYLAVAEIFAFIYKIDQKVSINEE
ncbi:EscU/YscU/HrcU family type III secretion system export apparatus switch protein [Ferdinandcohnia quinoae]|uniref:EscU/YscU/HrcU family type III secretion system export apparatus switch protein n=1 Tax=Fredinandcohnia quinoae TaxID=2918902 RepID=A0AAW5E4T8_9BACI|nr:EscU/YscU/HrcU family type III secretion system export apparatus switch protein [Fredinandcohnia sp. SECRCQ15]MCH1623799.1 EscU/YscU/HrcU family type III secretion system export apparatus switch protein [Fredinandcohnia sp. SECRCQ15]